MLTSQEGQRPGKSLGGLRYLPDYLDAAAQRALLAELQEALGGQEPYICTMPRSGQEMSVRMQNLGPLAWFSDHDGYRYIERHPVTGAPWPAIPPAVLALWQELANYPAPPECCLINWYGQEKARMGLHQDRDEEDFAAPVLSISLGDSAVFRIGGPERKSPTRSFRLHSGDLLLLEGESRLFFHGIDRILYGSSRLLPQGGRLNITLRRVTKP